MVDIINSFSNIGKLEKVLEDKSVSKEGKIRILQTLDIDTLIRFLIEGKEKLRTQCNIKPYEIVGTLDSIGQRKFVTRLERMDFTLSEKKEIIVTLNDDVKLSISRANFPEEYKSIISIPTQYRKNKKEVLFDPRRDLEDYRGLDTLIRPFFAEEFKEEDRNTFIKLCDVCPNLTVISSVSNSVGVSSTGADYKEAEAWISSIIDNLDPNYSKAQKMAIIDNAIGKKISYSPDWGTEVFDKYDSRALWKIISSGYGVCNGIAKVEQYILRRVGIQSEIVKSANHAFLKIKDIELPLASGETVKGNTILDPTWNLAANRFGGRPDSFCVSYEQARKNDVNEDEIDRQCHKNDEALQDVTLGLDEQSLRKLFTSIGLANRDGVFPIQKLLEKSKLIDEIHASEPTKNIDAQFLLLLETCPEFTECQEETMTILKDVLLNNENLHFNKCAINRVYDKTDKDKKPILYVYIDFGELGKKFYYADKNIGQFTELPQEEFIKRFDCFEYDLKDSMRN